MIPIEIYPLGIFIGISCSFVIRLLAILLEFVFLLIISGEVTGTSDLFLVKVEGVHVLVRLDAILLR